MIMRLSGQEHRVATGFALVAPGGAVRTAAVVLSRVLFRRIEPRAVVAYIATGEADDKAGAYAIQGRGGVFVEQVRGSVSNVVGLPLTAVARLLQQLTGWVPRR